MEFVVRKRNKYLKNYGYTSIASVGYKFFWTKNKSDALILNEKESIRFSKLTNGKKMILI